ncbi:MAG TPA: hypothetical protein VH988_29915 [Thermoanaerobaculia bacterium]|jgi:hypothetical protein|nr:hypothetical protein [Thermoanaerobaculia bacterium]
MSCPNWRVLASHREEEAAWDAAVAHFDGGCRLCRRDALTAEPTLVFRQLRGVGPAAMSPAQEASEVDAVRQAVAAMRTASRVESRSKRAGWKRWAAAAALAAAALSIPADNAWRHLTAERQELASQPESMLRGAVVPAAYGREADPALSGTGRPGARVYHMDGDGMSVVMIVDESLDV